MFYVYVSGCNDDEGILTGLMVKLFYKNKGNACAVGGEIRRINNLRRGPLST